MTVEAARRVVLRKLGRVVVKAGREAEEGQRRRLVKAKVGEHVRRRRALEHQEGHAAAQLRSDRLQR